MTTSIKQRFDLHGKVAVVTGASKGIGAAIAAGLAEFGAQVVVSSRNQQAVDEVAAAITSDGGQALAIAAHVGKPDDLDHLVAETCHRLGGIDIVVNNAAVNPVFGPLAQADSVAFDKIMGVNLKAPFELARRVYPTLCSRGGGAVVNISSVGAIRPEPLLGLYSVSKAALVSLTQVLAREWASDGIRVNAICPGLIKTRFSEALWRNESHLADFLARVPLGRIAEPDEVAPLALFLASSAAAYCTGAVFTVDGGLTI